jgi:YVTN family beta-propeller protein
VPGTVTPMVAASGRTGTPIRVGSRPATIAITPDGKTAYVTNGGSDTVTPIDTRTQTARAAIRVGGGTGSDGHRALRWRGQPGGTG